MKLTERIAKVKESNISKLYFEGSPVGFRVKVFNLDTCVFDYYDFTMKTISENAQAVSFLRSVEYKYKMGRIDLKRVNGLLVSDEELDGTITVQEFKDALNSSAVLRQVQLVYIELEKDENSLSEV